jgi:hypothetical protein
MAYGSAATDGRKAVDVHLESKGNRYVITVAERSIDAPEGKNKPKVSLSGVDLDELTEMAIEAAIEVGIDASAVNEAVEQAADGMRDLLIEAGGAKIGEGGATTVYADEHEALTQLPKKRIRDACGIGAKETIGDYAPLHAVLDYIAEQVEEVELNPYVYGEEE